MEFLAKIRESATAITAVVSLLIAAGGAYLHLEARMKNYTPLETHKTLVATVEQTGVNVEEVRLMGQLQWFQHQYRTQCRTPQEKLTENCLWLKDQIANIERTLQSLRPR